MIALLILAAMLAPSAERPAALDPTGAGEPITSGALIERARQLSGLPDREAAASYIESAFRSAGVAPAVGVAPFLDGYRHRFTVAWAEIDPNAGPPDVVVKRGNATTRFGAVALPSAPAASKVEPTDEVFLVDAEDLAWLGAREGQAPAPSLPGGVVVSIQRDPEALDQASAQLADQARGALRLGASALILVEASGTPPPVALPGPPPDLLVLRAGPDLAIDLIGRQELARLAAPRLFVAEPAFRPILLDVMLGASGPYRRAQRPGVSLIGYLAGADPLLRKEAVLVASSYGEPKAGDSPAGLAALLEMARLFAGPARRPSRSLLLASLDGERADFAGSHALAARLDELDLTIVAAVALDPLAGEAGPLRLAGVPTFACAWRRSGRQAGPEADPEALAENAAVAARTVWELAR